MIPGVTTVRMLQYSIACSHSVGLLIAESFIFIIFIFNGLNYPRRDMAKIDPGGDPNNVHTAERQTDSGSN